MLAIFGTPKNARHHLKQILGVDPGGTTGFCVIEYGPDSKPVLKEAWQEAGGLGGVLAIRDKIIKHEIVVCESFTLRPGVKMPDLSPVYIIGALEALMPYQDSLVYQQPSAKVLCPDDKLKKIGMYQVAKPHANDAIRHAIIYLVKTNHQPTIEWLWDKEN